MTTLEYGRWNPPFETTLKALEGQFQDIWDARDFFKAFVEVSEQKAFILQDAVVTAAVIRYGRSFGQGMRPKLKIEQLPNLTAKEEALHNKIIAVRNKYVAHPVNMQETHSIYIGYQVDPNSNAVATVVSTGTLANIALSLTDALNSIELCSRWLAWLHEENLNEGKRLLEHAKRMTSSELLALPKGPMPTEEDPEKKRRR